MDFSMLMEMNMYYTEGYYYMDMLGTKMKMPMDIAEMMEGTKDGTSATDISTDGMMELEMEEKDDSYVISFVGDTEKCWSTQRVSWKVCKAFAVFTVITFGE